MNQSTDIYIRKIISQTTFIYKAEEGNENKAYLALRPVAGSLVILTCPSTTITYIEAISNKE